MSVTLTSIAPAPHAEQNERIIRVALRKAGLYFCRHSWMLLVLPDRLALRCPSCNAETVGIRIGPARVSRKAS